MNLGIAGKWAMVCGASKGLGFGCAQALAREGVKRLAVITPGFAADCLETLEEIGVENAEYFHEAGGEKFAALPCLNDSDEGLAVLEAVARRELLGWA